MGVCTVGQRISCRWGHCGDSSLWRSSPWSRMCLGWIGVGPFFSFRFLVPHNLMLALDPWISQSIDGFGIGPQAATFTFHRRGFWHLKLEKNDQIHPNCIIPSRRSKHKIAILWNSATVLPVFLSYIVLVLLFDCRSWMMNISLFGKVSQESLGITKPRPRKWGKFDKVGTG